VSDRDDAAAWRVQTEAPEDTEAIAAGLAGRLAPGDVVLVRGDLGAGKTTFVRGAARALGVSEPVTSPTFTIGQAYAGNVPVSHLDLYRLADAGVSPSGDLGDEDAGLIEDYLSPGAIAFVEWPQVAADLFDDPAAVVDITFAPGGGREIAIAGRRTRKGQRA